MEDYTVTHHANGIEVSTVVDTKTDGSYRHSKLYIMYTEQEALESFDADVQNIYGIYGKAEA